jgi:hypothetical protein
VEVRGANRQTILSLFRRDIKDTAHRTFPQSKKRQRPISSEFSSSDKSGPSDHFPLSRKKIMLSLLSRNYSSPRYRRPYYLFSNNFLNELISTGKRKISFVIEKSSRKTQKTEYLPSFGPRNIFSNSDNG